MRVLVVDDGTDAADSLALILKMWGHEVQVAYDGPTGLEAALATSPEVIILDIALAGLNGWDIAARLRGMPGFDQTLLLAMSGFAQESDVQQSRAAGFDQHLVKPCDLDELRRVLEARHKPPAQGGELADIATAADVA